MILKQALSLALGIALIATSVYNPIFILFLLILLNISLYIYIKATT